MKITFVLACITIIVGLIVYMIFYKKKKNMKKDISFALFIGIIAITVLIYPLQQDYKNTFVRIFASFIYALRCSGMGQNLQLLSKIDLSTVSGSVYFVLINTLFVIMPILTISFILSFIESALEKISLKLLKNKNLHIFSCINEKTLLIAKSLNNEKDSKIIFAGVDDKSKISRFKCNKCERKNYKY